MLIISYPFLQFFYLFHQFIKLQRFPIDKETSHVSIIGFPRLQILLWYHEIDGGGNKKIVVYILQSIIRSTMLHYSIIE